MGIRKGQFISNYLRFKLKVPREHIDSYLYGMHDEEFEKIEHEYRMYVISKMHDPNEWHNAMKEIAKESKKWKKEYLEKQKAKKPKRSK